MSIQTLNWVPPSLCGCQIKMTANFTDESNDGNAYRHPTPFTITNLEVVSVCDGHKDIPKSMPDTSRLFDLPESGSVEHFLVNKGRGNPQPVQHRGYLRYPIANPTPAECLYTFLSFHRGQTHSLPCGCSSFMHFDEVNHVGNPQAVATYKNHPKHSKKCNYHKDDTVDMVQAQADHKEYLAAASTNEKK